MGYTHTTIGYVQSPKRHGDPCGDVVAYERSVPSTVIICADGLGSGVKANIAATMLSANVLERLRGGASLRQTFARLVRTMNESKDKDLPYAAFSIIRVLNDGNATILSYEVPPPILVGPSNASVLAQRTTSVGSFVVAETNCYLHPGEGILVFSDGVTMAGLGLSMTRGWGIEGVSRLVNDCIARKVPLARLPQRVHDRARSLWENVGGDDVTVALALCSAGRSLHVLTGPPISRDKDHEVAANLMRQEGAKVVCGATTATIVANYLGRELEVEQAARVGLSPPRYMLEGVDLVSEGAVTLNQVYNVLDEPTEALPEDSGVTRLHRLLSDSDRIHFILGTAANPAHEDIGFLQRGILPRAEIVPMIAQKLRAQGKVVLIEPV